MTQKRNGEWRALVNDGIVHSLSHLGNVYKAELAKELERQGFTLRYDRNGTFDLAHFTEHQIDEFSGRRNQIDARLAEWGLNRETATAEQRDRAAMQTRERKTEIDRDDVRAAWQARAKELGIDFYSREWAGVGNDGLNKDGLVRTVVRGRALAPRRSKSRSNSTPIKRCALPSSA